MTETMVDEPKSQAAGLNARPVRSPQTVTVAMGFDDGYTPHAAAVIASIVNASDPAAFRFLMLTTGVPRERQRQVELIAPASQFVWITVGPDDLPELKVKGAIAHVNHATFLRLALERVAPADCERVIYLDADLIVTGDLRDLWAIDLGGAVVAGCHDQFIKPEDFAAKWALPPATLGYFNAGVLLIDLKQVQEGKLFSRALDFVLQNNPAFADQDALNWALWNRWREVDPSWNVGRHLVLPALHHTVKPERRLNGRQPRIIHYTGPEKPWLKDVYHPWSWLYWQALSRTPFLGEVKQAQKIGLRDMARIWLRWQRRQPPRIKRDAA
jgi:lipopolysaccharide biosynthesis glycosyltransferase